MNKISITTLALAATISGFAFADGADDDLLSRNHIIGDMRFNAEKLGIQAQMAKSYKDMNDAGFIVDPQGVPLGIGDMERLAIEVRRRGGMQALASGNVSDPFGSGNPAIPMNSGQSLFGDAGFPVATPPPQPPAPPVKEESKEAKVEVVAKPTPHEKDQGKQVLRLVELRGKSATLFTNDGFKEVVVGQNVYDQKVTRIGPDFVTLDGKKGSRTVRIDWSKSVRYSDD